MALDFLELCCKRRKSQGDAKDKQQRVAVTPSRCLEGRGQVQVPEEAGAKGHVEEGLG